MKKSMRVISVILVIIVLMTVSRTFGFSEDSNMNRTSKKQINIFGSFGLATSQLDDALLDLGVEFQMFKGLFARIVLNSHLDVGHNRYYGDYSGLDYGYYYGSGFGLNDGTALHGISIYGVYKISIIPQLKLCFLSGLSYLSYWKQVYNSQEGEYLRDRSRGYGGDLGAAIEYFLSEKLGIFGGGTYRKLFEDQYWKNPNEPAPGKPSWVHIYVGLSYRVK